MSTYLKHMGRYKHKQLMGKSYDEIQKLFDKEMNRVNTFVAMSSEAQESNEKKVEGSEEKAKSSRKKSLDEHKEVEVDDTTELKNHLVIKKDDDIAIDVIPLATKPPVIVDYTKLYHKERMMTHYQLIRAYESSKRYSLTIRLLQDASEGARTSGMSSQGNNDVPLCRGLGKSYGQKENIVKDCIWLFEQEHALGFSSVLTNTRMTVIKLKSGGLWVYAPIAPTKECIDGHSHIAVVYKDLNKKIDTLKESKDTENAAPKYNSHDADSDSVKNDEDQQAKRSPPSTPNFKKRHRGCSFCILDLESNPIPKYPSFA
ncbi:DUF21 domain-containing protein [Tanacetum coccineum]